MVESIAHAREAATDAPDPALLRAAAMPSERATTPSMPPRRSRIGAVSLIVAVLGAVACRLALAYGLGEQAPWLRVLAAGFEAAMVGGIADWFAVTALFRHPLGIPIPHTALIVERRDKLVDGIVATVQDEWLSPDVIGAKLATLAPSTVILDWLRDPEHVGRLGGPLRDLLRRAARVLTEPELATFTERTIRRELADLPMDAAGRWLSSAASSQSAQAAFESVALSLANLADRPRTSDDLHFWLDRSAATLRAGGKRLVPLLLRRRVVQRRLIDAICSYASAELHAAADEPAHPLRRLVFEAIEKFGDRLANGDERALRHAEALRGAVVDSLDSERFVHRALTGLRRQLEHDLATSDSALSSLIDRSLRGSIVEWLDDPEHRRTFDEWVRTMSQDLLQRHHHQIGRTVREYLEGLKNEELVARIEGRVGSDLQYIRLNGAVIGGLVGMGLAMLHLMFG